MFLRFEFCGLNQLYVMWYGIVLVVYVVGGLKDIVQLFNFFNELGLGWIFDMLDVDVFIYVFGNVMWIYYDFKSSWKGIQ